MLLFAGNHSCVPNAEIEFTKQNNTLSLVALEDIAPDEVGTRNILSVPAMFGFRVVFFFLFWKTSLRIFINH